jgi:hypothetical protein
VRSISIAFLRQVHEYKRKSKDKPVDYGLFVNREPRHAARGVALSRRTGS